MTTLSESTTRSGPDISSVAAWGLAGIAAVAAVAAAVFHVLDRNVATDLTQWWLTNLAAAIGLGIPGAMIAARRPRNPIGWILLTTSLAQAFTVAGREYAVYTLAVHPGSLPGGIWGAWIGSWGYTLTSLVGIAILLFPDGRFRSRIWWIPATMLGLGTGVMIFGSAFWPGAMLGGPGRLNAANPLGWSRTITIVSGLGFRRIEIFMTVAVGLSVVGLLARLRDADRSLKRQIAVIALPTALVSGEYVWELWSSSNLQPFLAPVFLTVFSCAVAAAVLRYGLYQVDRSVNRAIVYSSSSALLLAIYLAAVAATDQIFGHTTLGGSLLAATLVALLFAPIRTRLQVAGDRVLYGARRDPYLVMSSLSEPLPEADAALPALAETLARMLKLPFVAIELDNAKTQATSSGTLHNEPLILPLVFQGVSVGRLVLSHRAHASTFDRDERRLLDDVARQVAVVAYAVNLTEDLQQSRERIVLTREEERRRVRRDLHDGLGPTLAGIALQLDAARAHLYGDVSAADDLMGAIVQQTRTSIMDIRRLVDELRPPALDELGLASALREQGNRFPGLHVEIVAPDDVADLPAAVEVAAYRIATEAVTNVARHASAGRCTVTLSLNGALHVDITDDGQGMPEGWRAGTGVTSIRERAAELGGTCSLRAADGGGTIVSARLPVVAM